VATYLQSGNVVVSSTSQASAVGREISGLIQKRFGLDIAVIRLVTFMAGELPCAVVERMHGAAGLEERFEVIGREVYSWHPAGVGPSPLWARIVSKGLGVDATTRNWSTVTVLLAMAAR